MSTAGGWPEGKVLSWSGKWHIPRMPGPAAPRKGRQLVTLCGAYGYVAGEVPETASDRLQRIVSGRRSAPECRRCTAVEALDRGQVQ